VRVGEGRGEGLWAGALLAITLATPALSAAGAWPPGFSGEQLEGRLGEIPLRLVAAAVPGFVLVGGWDLARKQPKPLRRALPAGSVFLFEPLDRTAAEAVGQLDGMCISDFSGNDGLAQQGFGLIAAGVS
jgi:CRISPR-associated protein Cmr3